jgi:hypothetical protein
MAEREKKAGKMKKVVVKVVVKKKKKKVKVPTITTIKSFIVCSP